ncbi:MAG: Fe-S cluster assembly protein SufD [Chloroflexi bacterium]|nr:MAG: Fe-S cluster assembly protein SufD [Chloroflexota bacterium]
MATQLQTPGAIGPEAVTTRAANAPAWLAERRRAAWEAYTALPMPDRTRDEDWRRTDIRGLEPDEYVVDPGPTGHGAGLVEAMREMRDRIAPDAAFVASTRNGVRALEGAEALRAQGVTVCSLEDAAVHDEAAVRRALAHVPVDGSKFTALWNALWRGGCFVHVPTGVEAAVPIVAAHSAAGDHAAILPATVVVLEAGASLTLVELEASPAAQGTMLSDAVSILHLGEGSRLDHCLLQRWSASTWHLATHRGVLERDSRLRFFAATFGSRLQKVYWDALLEGQGADATLTGVCFGGGDQHLDHQSLQAHRAPATRSDLLLKVAVRDRAQSVYGGLITVDRAAQRTDGYVQNRNLMLSRGARASGIPMLEIKANDVRCSHGVTAGHIDTEQRFYLQSRGVDPEAADRLIVRGFMQDALDRSPHAGFAEFVGGVLDEVVAGHSAAGVEAEGLS